MMESNQHKEYMAHCQCSVCKEKRVNKTIQQAIEVCAKCNNENPWMRKTKDGTCKGDNCKNIINLKKEPNGGVKL